MAAHRENTDSPRAELRSEIRTRDGDWWLYACAESTILKHHPRPLELRIQVAVPAGTPATSWLPTATVLFCLTIGTSPQEDELVEGF